MRPGPRVRVPSGHPEEIADLKARIKTLKRRSTATRPRRPRRALQEAIAGELKAAGLDPANKTQCSQVFLEDLAATADPARRKAKIDDRKQLVGAARPAAGSPPPFTRPALQESHDAPAVPPADGPARRTHPTVHEVRKGNSKSEARNSKQIPNTKFQ